MRQPCVENCVFSAIQNSAAWLLGGANSFRNCVFSGCQSIVSADYNTSFYSETPSFRNCVFTGFDRWFNDTSIETDDNVQFSHCCFWNRRDANSDVCEMAGTDGNIFVDPGFADAENGDWRITSASPCVDAGDASAPERDAYGQPRQNVKAVPTGVRNANGRYADIGIYEVIPLSGAEDAPDLEVFDLSAPTAMTVGSEATVTYKLCNVSDENDVLGEVRVDRVELIDSNGTAVEVYRAARPAVRIARRRGTVISETAAFTVPALSPGIVTVRVTVNCERDIFEGVLYENNTVQKSAVRLEAPEVTFDSLAGRTLAIPAGGSFSCHLAGEQAAERLLVLRGGEAGAITARTATDGAMPTAGAFATQSVAPGGSDSLLVLPAGETVSLAIGNSGGTTANVTLQDLGTGLVLYDPGEAVTAVNTNFLYNATRKRQNGIMKDFREIEVRNYVPSSPKGLYVRAGAKYVGLDTNAMRVVQMRFWGNGFTDGTTAALVCGGRRIEPMEFTVNSRTSAYASFEYYGCEPGEYALEVSDGGTVRTTGTRFALWEPVDYYLNGGDEMRLLPGNPDELEVSVSKFPSKLRGGRVYTGAVSWRNSTDKELDAPYLRLVAVNDHIRLNESRPWGTQIDVIGLSATPPYDKIKPGESRTMSFQFIAPDSAGYIDVPVALNTPLKGTQENATPSDLPSGRGTTRFLNNQVRAVRLQTLPGKPSGPVAADGTEAYPWDQNAPYYRSPAMNDELWTLFYSQMRSLYGETWGTFSARLRSRAAAFAGAYRKPPVAIETGDITCADGMRIIGDSRVCPVIETACDLKRPGRGAAFKLERTYGSTLQNRMSDGIFGRGWTTVFDVRLVKRGDSEASISRPGWTGSRYAMAPDDTVWRKTAGAGQSTFDGRVERHADGSYNAFAEDGLLLCCYDRYGNGYAIERDGARRITKVQHSDGAYFTFAYDGASPVPSRVTDDVGNEATYTYTVSDGVYMLASAETSRGTAEYTYREADATAASCALVRLEGGGPNMATCSLTWDARGRVTSITEYDSFTKEFIYETDDRIRIVDASGHETVIEFTPWGDVASSTQPDGGVARLEYEEGISQPVGYVWPSGRRVDCEFDAAGNLVQMTSSTGKSTKFTYNNESDLSQVSSVMGTRTYSFDENGEYSGVRSGAGRSMSFGWNSETGDLAEESYPDGVHGWNYEYGQYGLLSSIVSKDSKLRYRYEYDAEGRIVRAAVVRKAASEAQASASLMSASGTRRAARLFGNPPDDGEETCVETLVYDSKGRLQSFTSNGHTVEFGYDKKGRLTSIIDEDGEGERFTYDSKGRVTQVIDAADSSIVHVTYAYDDMHGGRLASETFGNGMVTTYGYTVNGKVASVRTMYGDNPIAEYWYTYNRDGKISACGEAVAGERNDFLYNGDGQIVDVVYTDPDGKKQDSSNVTEAKKTYDDVLGYLTKLEKGDVEWEYLYDEFNYLAEIKNGDKSTTVTYERDAYGKVVSITVDGKKTEKVKIPSKDYTINIYEEDGTKKHVINSPMGTVGVTVSGGSSGSGKKQNYNVKDKNGTTKQTVDRDGNRTSYQSCNQRKNATDNSTTTPAQTYYGDPDEQIEESSSNRDSSAQKQNQDNKDTGTSTAKQSENPDDTGAKVSPDACYLPENNEQNQSKWGPAEQLQWEKQQQREEAARQAAEAAAQEQKQKEEEEARKAEEEAQQAAEQDRKENDRSLKDILDDSDNSLVNLIDELFESLEDETDASMSRNRNRKKQKKKEAREHLDNAKEEAKDLAVDAALRGLPKKVKPVVKPLKKALDYVNCP